MLNTMSDELATTKIEAGSIDSARSRSVFAAVVTTPSTM